MKTLVIGGAGLVGSAVVKELGKRGAEVRVFARNKSAVMDADKDAVEVAEGDLLDPATDVLRFAFDAGIQSEQSRRWVRRIELPIGVGMFGRVP